MKTKFAIIGGGVAGLCAAIRLKELGADALVIESGNYPAHKICGEFLSPECLHYLNQWDIHPVKISKAKIRSSFGNLDLPFEVVAGGLSHLELDPLLAKKAYSYGVEIKTNTKVMAFEQKNDIKKNHRISLSDQTEIEASNVIIAAGRFNSYLAPSTKPYVGFKAHFKNTHQMNHLEMFSLPGAYLGVSPVENNKINVACIAKSKKIGDSDPQIFIEDLINKNSFLSALLLPENKLFKEWMVSPIPEFGFKETPDWLDSYFIGDAAMTIPPASGSGLSLAIFGGRLAAEYAVNQKHQEFKKMWKRHCATQLKFAKILHQFMLNPKLSSPILALSHYFPGISKKLFELTRFKIIPII